MHQTRPEQTRPYESERLVVLSVCRPQCVSVEFMLSHLNSFGVSRGPSAQQKTQSCHEFFFFSKTIESKPTTTKGKCNKKSKKKERKKKTKQITFTEARGDKHAKHSSCRESRTNIYLYSDIVLNLASTLRHCSGCSSIGNRVANDFHEDAIRCEITHFLWPSSLYQLINKVYTFHTHATHKTKRRCVKRTIWRRRRENVRHINAASGHISHQRCIPTLRYICELCIIVHLERQ